MPNMQTFHQNTARLLLFINTSTKGDMMKCLITEMRLLRQINIEQK